MHRSLFFMLFFFCNAVLLYAQADTTKPAKPVTPLFGKNGDVVLKDSAQKAIVDTPAKTATRPKHDPRKATFRSAVLPGWGQAYNHQYWKIPIVYGVLAIPFSTYIYNNDYYQLMKFGYQAKYAAQILHDSSLINQVSSKVKRTNGTLFELSTYQNYRNAYKRDRDYSLIWFLVLWGLNVADATVFAHLKDFDVSDNLSMHINPLYFPDTKSKGVSLVVTFKNPAPKALPSY